MRLYLKTSDQTCQVWLDQKSFEWEVGRGLSKGLLRFLQQCLEGEGRSWNDLTGVVVFRGSGSYTSLRIGLTVANTLADSLNIPIVGASGNNWRPEGDRLLVKTKPGQIITPIYDQPVHITSPRK